MPDLVVIAADQALLSDGLDNASVVVHRRNSHENQARSLRRRRLIATRKIESVDMIADQPQALLWNPDGLPFEDAAKMLGVRSGTVAILGGTEIFGLTHVAGLRLPFGRAVFPEVPQHSPQAKRADPGRETDFGCVAQRNIVHLAALCAHLASPGAFELIQATVILLNGDVRLLQG
jgi:hypothetical protein